MNNKNNNYIDNKLLSFINNEKSKKGLNNLFIIALFIFAAIILWSIFTGIEQTLYIKGHITPQSGIAKLRHDTGGMVTEIHVNNYNKVKKGDLLVTLDDKKILTSLKQLRSKLKVVDTEITHTVAFLQDNLTLLNSVIKKQNQNDLQSTDQDVTQNIKKLQDYLNNITDTISYSAELTTASKIESDNKDQIILNQIKKNKIEIERLEEESIVLKEQLEYLDEQRQIFNKLLESKNVSKIRALDFEIKYREALREFKKAKSDKEFKIKETNELESKRIVQKQDIIKEKYEELIKLNKEKIDLTSNINQLETNLKNLKITSPIDGIIQGIEVVVGVNINPSEEIMSIIPTDSEMIFEGQATMHQKGKISEFSKAQVQFDGFNILKYDRINANIISISPYTFEDKDSNDQNDYFKVVAKLDADTIKSSSNTYKINPGMSGTLYVTTEEQSIFAYIFGPIYNAFSDVSNER